MPCLVGDLTSDFDGPDVKLIDGASMVHSMRPDRSIESFHDYAKKIIIPFIEKHLAIAKRVDVIWDRYLPESLKATTRKRRGTGVRQRLPSDGNGKC